MSIVGQAFVEVLPVSTGFAGKLQNDLTKTIQSNKAQIDKSFTGLANAGKKVTAGVAAGVLAVGAMSVRAASNFDSLTLSLVTGAGESEKNLESVRQGILKLAPAMGTSTTDLTNGLYMIESAGFHGAAGLNVLKAAAEGAKVGNADLSTVANAVTTALTDYHLPAAQAASVTSMLIETVASGKTHMQDLAGALSNVLPVAAAAHISLEDVNGALATMTAQGISAQQASQNVANVIRQLQNPSQQARNALEQLGLNVTDLQTHLGTRGLQGTLELITTTIAQHMGPQGLVLVNALKQSQAAAADAQQELKHIPPSLQSLARGFLDGTVTQTAWRKSMKSMGVDQRELMQQFAATVGRTRGFNDALKAGGPAAKTLSSELSTVLGGATGLDAALALTGPNMATYKQNLVNIYNAGVSAKNGLPTKEVQGFNLIQKDFAFQVDQGRQAVQVFLIQLGEKLIPIIQKVIVALTATVHWLTEHKTVALVLAGVVGGALTLAIAAYVAQMIKAIATTTGGFVKMIAEGAAWVVETISQFTVADGAATVFGMTMESVGAASAIAMAGTILIIAAVAAAAYLIITHWRQIPPFFERLWHDVSGFFIHLWGDVEDITRSAVNWITGTFNSAVGSVSGFFTRMWGDIVATFHEAQSTVAGAVRAVVHTVTGIFDSIRTWFEHWWPVLLPIVTGLFLGPLGILVGVVVDEIILHWHQLVSITEDVFGALGWFFSTTWRLWSDLVNTVVGAIVGTVETAWNFVSGVTHAVFDALRPYLDAVWNVITRIFTDDLDLIVAAIEAVWGTAKAITHLVWDGISTYFEVWWSVLQAAFQVALALVEGVLQQAWIDVSTVAQIAWDALKAYFEAWWAVLRGIVQIAWDLIRGIFEVALDLIEGKWSAAWSAIRDMFSNIWGTIQQTASSVWGDITGFFSGALNAFEGWWTNTWNNIAGTFSGIWNGIAGGIAGVWKNITGGVKAGIHDVESVINSAFIGPINAVLGLFGVKITPLGGSGGGANAAAPGSSTAPAGSWGHKMESGGMIVDHPTVLVGEGRRGFPESVIPWDPMYRGRAHKLLAATIGAIGMPGLASGGIWGDITGAAGAVGGALSGAAGAALGGVKGALKWVDAHTVGPAIDAAAHAAEQLVSHIQPAIIGQATAGIIQKVAAGMKSMLGGGSGGGAGAGLKSQIPTGDHAGLIAQALQLAGQPVDGPDEAAVNIIVSHESGWNPQAINNWDVNAQHGDPSRGLMQTIGATFEAYRLAALPDNIYDPLANLVAGIRYAVSRYGTMTNVPGVVAVGRGQGYVGYDSGGWLMPGVTMAYNGTGRPEPIISPSGAGPAGSALGGAGVTVMPGAVTVQVELSGDTSTAAGIKQLIEQGTQEAVTEALEEMLDMMGSRNPASVRG